MIRYFYIFILTLTTHNIDAQDPFFSNPLFGGTYFSPSFVRSLDQPYSVEINYRSQWYAFDDEYGFNTTRVAGQFNIKTNKNYWTVSLDILNDFVGRSRYNQFIMQGGLAYTMQLSDRSLYHKPNIIRLGIQFGAYQQSFAWSSLWFGRQFDRNFNLVNLNLDNGEPNLENGRNSSGFIPNLNLGLYYAYQATERIRLTLDLSAHHLNGPGFTFNSSIDQTIQTRYNLFAALNIKQSRAIQFEPRYSVQFQKPYHQHTIGSSLNWNNDVEQSFKFGLDARLINGINGMDFDAVVISTLMRLKRLDLGLSYDVYVSGISDGARSQGAFELFLRYKPSTVNY